MGNVSGVPTTVVENGELLNVVSARQSKTRLLRMLFPLFPATRLFPQVISPRWAEAPEFYRFLNFVHFDNVPRLRASFVRFIC